MDISPRIVYNVALSKEEFSLLVKALTGKIRQDSDDCTKAIALAEKMSSLRRTHLKSMLLNLEKEIEKE